MSIIRKYTKPKKSNPKKSNPKKSRRKQICSIKSKNKYTNCINKNALLKLAKIINKNYGKNIINTSTNTLHLSISKYFKRKHGCNTDMCWVNNIELIDNIPKGLIKEIKSYFKPTKPKSWKSNKNTWLTNIDINNVLNQYQGKYKHFYYFGAVPDDFNLKSGDRCLVSKLCKFNLSDFKGYDSFSIVFNTDPSTKGGEHWTALYVDLIGKNKKKPCIYYFDSVGIGPSDNVLKLITKIQSQSNNKLKYEYNQTSHQKENTECGIYVIHFIISMLKGISFNKYTKNKKSDKFIEKFRGIYFN